MVDELKTPPPMRAKSPDMLAEYVARTQPVIRSAA